MQVFKSFCILLYSCLQFAVAIGQTLDLEKSISNAKMQTSNYARGAMDWWDEYPRPTLVRSNWQNLNGAWKYQISDSNMISFQEFEDTIVVPFPLESQLSGVRKSLLPAQTLWYFREVASLILNHGERCLLHFGAVDWHTEVFINGKSVGTHTGGYDSFSFDITDFIHRRGVDTILVSVVDPTDKGINPHGKQVLNPGNIYYTPTSGIWQTVWLEKVSQSRVENVDYITDIDENAVIITPTIAGNRELDEIVRVTIMENGHQVAIGKGVAGTPIKLILNQPRLWSPNDPFLYDVKVQLIHKGRVLDEVASYFGMRKISIAKDGNGFPRIQLNNKYIFNLGVLDQGFWPDGLYTAPTAHALKFDIATIKAMGFNTIRKHIKIEPQLWYYYADKLGMLVWQDFVNPPHGLPEGSKGQFENELKATIKQLNDHPSIICWVVFNEGWGEFDQERITELVKKLDTSRLVNGHSGQLLYVSNKLRKDVKVPWAGSDIADIHTYPFPRSVKGGYGKVEVIGEFGGITVSAPNHSWNDLQTWGYDTKTPLQFMSIYRKMIDSIQNLERGGLSAAIYTQPFDVETEENGLVSYDRAILKIPLDTLRSINAHLTHVNTKLPIDGSIARAFKPINVMDTDDRYTDYLKEIQGGRSDSSLLRRMILLALKKKDTLNLNYLTTSFVQLIKDPYNYDNVLLLTTVSIEPNNMGYSILIKDSAKVQQVIGQKRYKKWKKQVIQNRFIKPVMGSKEDVDWEAIGAEVSRIYGDQEKEYVWGAAMIQNLNRKDWKDFGTYYKKYFEVALDHSDYHINNMSWTVFENISDTVILEFAMQVSKYNCEYKDHSAIALDTYANLLYKLGERSEAIALQKRAIAVRPDLKELAEVLDKMQRGLPTWPVDSTQRN